MVTSVDNDQRSGASDAAAPSVLPQSAAPAVEEIPASERTAGEPPTDPAPAVDTGPGSGSDASLPPDAPVQDGAPADDPAATLAARLQLAEERVTSAEATLIELTARIGGWESRADQTEGAARALERAIAAADDQFEALTTRVTDLSDGAARDRAGTAAIGAEVAELQETVRRLDQDTSVAVARAVERHTTAELVDGQQRLHQASVAMAGLAQSLADAARQITPELTADSARTLLDSFAVDVDLLLQQLGHQALGVATGDPFDPQRHRALRRVSTTDSTADRTVARVLRDGYRTPATDRVLMFADVEVFRFTDSGPSGQDSAAATSSQKGT